ncbi:hypothetical protein EV424DRAFT_1471792 [Suillus variegatus]|nr:hypothetical protein EV424DRAFT_1471792 [Suillus variegatus]
MAMCTTEGARLIGTYPFHWHQTIKQHFSFWDEDKYVALKALTVIHALTAKLSVLKDTLNLTDADFIHFHKQEHSYLDGLKELLVKDKISIHRLFKAANHALVEIHVRGFHEMHVALNQAQVHIDGAYSKLQNEIGSEPYNHFRQEAPLLKYCTALDELEWLVVICLFELSKLSLSGTGYKLRQQIGKALQHHSEAIHNALNHYNTQAAALISP